jgi:hypothetical protein
MKAKLAVLLGVVGLLSAFPVFAHHSFAAEFDENKPLSITGTVTKVDWGNPHVYIYVDVKDNKGQVANWGIESQSVGELKHRGWAHEDLKIGDQVTAQGYVAKDGSRLLGARLVTLPGNRSVFVGMTGDGGPGDPTKQYK